MHAPTRREFIYSLGASLGSGALSSWLAEEEYGLSRESGVSREYLGKIELGKANPTLPVTAQISHGHGMTLEQFTHHLEDDGENPEWRKIEIAWRETELHQTGSTLAPLDFEDFIPAAENPLSKASDGKPEGLEAGAVPVKKMLNNGFAWRLFHLVNLLPFHVIPIIVFI